MKIKSYAQIAITTCLVSIFTACNAPTTKEGSQENSCKKEAKTECCTTKSECKPFSIREVINAPENYLGKSITAKGEAIHVCAHHGDKLFLAPVGDTVNYIVCKNKEGADAINPTLAGKVVCVNGTVKKVELAGDVETHHGKEVVYYIENNKISVCKTEGKCGTKEENSNNEHECGNK